MLIIKSVPMVKNLTPILENVLMVQKILIF
jgi:hypothetical protein